MAVLHLVEYYGRGFLEVVWFFVSLIYGILLTLTIRFRDPSISYYLGRTYSWGALKIAGVKVACENQSILYSRKPAVYVSNHQSVIDFAFCCAVVPKETVCIAKRSFMYVPFLGLFWWLGNQIFIDRASRNSAISTLDNAEIRIKQQKHSVWIFPEGTRNYNPEKLLPFKKGAFHLAIKAQVPIIATVIAPLSTFVDSTNKRWKPGSTMKMKVLPPFETKGLKPGDVDALINKVYNGMQAALDDIIKNDKKQITQPQETVKKEIKTLERRTNRTKKKN